MARPWVLMENTLPDIRRLQPEVAVLPHGSTEPHGGHLPYGSDFYHGSHVADEACRRAFEMGAKVVLLPGIPYGNNRQTFGFPLAINMDPSVQFQVLKNIVESLEHSTVNKLVIVNAHGGNEHRSMLRALSGTTRLFVCAINWWQMPDMLKQWADVGEHADVMETSVNLAVNPELVHMENASDGATRPVRLEGLKTGYVYFARMWHHLTESSGAGNPAGSSADAGKRFVEAAIDRISRFLKELSDAPLDETFPFQT